MQYGITKTNLAVIGIAFLAIVSGLAVYFLVFSVQDDNNIRSFMKSSDAPIPYDLVTVTIYDKTGKLKYQETTHNIVTAAGAIWFCVEQNGCSKQINGTTPAVTNVAAPTLWIQFISGTANAGEPAGGDCTTGVGGVIAGNTASGRCVTNFGLLAPSQYGTGGSIISLSSTGSGGQLQANGVTIDGTNKYVKATPSTVCTVANGTSLTAGTCQFTETSPVFTNPLTGSTIMIGGLALASGTADVTTAGPLIIAESALLPAITVIPGDTVSVTWTITT